MSESTTQKPTSWRTIWFVLLGVVLTLEGLSRLFPVPPVEPLTDTLYQYQMAKVERLPEGAIVLVGDSCLGNAVDARALSEQLGRPVVNLALTRVDSFRGDLAVLKRLLSRGKRPALVISVHAPDTFPKAVGRPFLDWLEREQSQQGLAGIAGRFFSLSALVQQGKDMRTRLFAVEKGLRSLGRESQPLDEGLAERKAGLEQHDYLPQREERWDETRLRPFAEFALSEGHREGMDQLRDFCQQHELKLLFATGPSYQGAYTPSFLAGYGEFLEGMAMPRLYQEIPLYPRDSFGDSINHLTPEARTKFTSFFASYLENFNQK